MTQVMLICLMELQFLTFMLAKPSTVTIFFSILWTAHVPVDVAQLICVN